MLPTLQRAQTLKIRAPSLRLAVLRTQRSPLAIPITSLSTVSRSRTRPSLVPDPACRLFHPAPNLQRDTKPPLQPKGVDKEAEKEIAGRTLEARPDEVTSTSSVRRVLEQSQTPPASDPDLLVGLKGDIETVKETFALSSVPRNAYALGLAGTVPYLATSLSTVYLSWNLNTQWPTGSIFMNSVLLGQGTAEHWLHLLQPIQVGYGAVIISFLGAIHWGLEFAEKSTVRDRTRFRYAIGVLAPAVAWPTIFMPIEWALTTQFAAFLSLYFVDSRATVKGWAPAWYGTYRFVLTAVVGSAIIISLIGRAQVGEGPKRLSTEELRDRMGRKGSPGGKHHNWAKEEAEEKERIKEEKKQEEEKRKQAEKKAKKEEEEKKKAKKSGEKGEGKKGEGKKGEEKKGEEKAEEKKGEEKKDKENKDEKNKSDEKPKEQEKDQKEPRQAEEGGEKSEDKAGAEGDSDKQSAKGDN